MPIVVGMSNQRAGLPMVAEVIETFEKSHIVELIRYRAVKLRGPVQPVFNQEIGYAAKVSQIG